MLNKYFLGLLLAISSNICHSETQMDFVKRFMDSQLVGGKYSIIDEVKFISKKFLIKNEINVFELKFIGLWAIEKYVILNEFQEYVDVKIISPNCMKNACPEKVLRLKIVSQDEGFAVEPRSYYRSTQKIFYSWQVIEGNYQL